MVALQVEESLKRRGLVVNNMYKLGLAKLLVCITDKSPSGDGLPVHLLSNVSALRSIFFMLNVCKTDKYDCNECWYRNTCVAETLLKVKKNIVKLNKQDVNIGEVLQKGANGYRISGRDRAIIEVLRRYILYLGGAEIEVCG
jgi:hypothetical protein